MAYSNTIRMLPEECRSLAFGSIVAGYTAIGAALENPARIILVQNFTDAVLMFSFDGLTDHFPLSDGGHIIIDIAANKTLGGGFFMAEGDTLYVKRVDIPTTNSVYFSAFYGTDG